MKYEEYVEHLENIVNNNPSYDYETNMRALISYAHNEELTQLYKSDMELDKGLARTNNVVYPRPLPFPSIHLECNVPLTEGTLKYLHIWVGFNYTDTGINILEEGYTKEYMDILNEAYTTRKFWINYMGIIEDEGEEIMVGESFNFPEGFAIKTEYQQYMEGEFKKISDIEPCDQTNPSNKCEDVKKYLCNLMDTLMMPEVEVIEKKTGIRDRNGNGKNITYNEIKIGKKVRRLFESGNGENEKYSHAFWVSGHFRHYFDKKRWKNIYQEKPKGYFYDGEGYLTQLISPFIKGTGKIIKKVRKLGRNI